MLPVAFLERVNPDATIRVVLEGGRQYTGRLITILPQKALEGTRRICRFVDNSSGYVYFTTDSVTCVEQVPNENKPVLNGEKT